jgi:leucyl aminopeptidase
MKFNIQLKSAKTNSNKPAGGIVKFFIDGEDFQKESKKFLEELGLQFDAVKIKRIFAEDKNSISLNPESGNYDVVQIQKIKIDKKFSADFFRNACAKLIKSTEPKTLNYIDIVIPDFDKFEKFFQSEEYYYQSFAEGVLLGNYNFDKYKLEKKKPVKLGINLIGRNTKLISKKIKEAENLIESVCFARDLSNEPAITLTPQELAARSKKKLTKLGVSVAVFNKQELKKRKMTAVLAVGDASAHPPLMIVMRYKPKVKAKKKIALVGKGVTFDSGGLSIKPSDAMIEMKGDMNGAATVIGTIHAAAKAKLPVEIIGVVPAVENMLAGNSYKPGDIVMASNGKSIDVGNTDAEGRVILADALHFASKEKPDEIIDYATLTGACLVALGDFVAGLFTNYDQLAEKLLQSGNSTHERVWRLPLWHEYGKLIESDLADVKNVGPRWGGAITAAKFLEHFVDENIPWAHLDLAGPSIKHKATSYTEDFNTGFGIRLTIDYLSR